jgi:hypothetical protein
MHDSCVQAPNLRPNEHVINTFRANRSQGWRAVGGHVLITSERVIFYPHKVDEVTGAGMWTSELDQISNASVAPRGRNPFNGSLRQRLMVVGANGTELFVLRSPNEVVDAILDVKRDQVEKP